MRIAVHRNYRLMHLLGTISRNDGFIGIIIITSNFSLIKMFVRIHYRRDYAKRRHPPLNDMYWY